MYGIYHELPVQVRAPQARRPKEMALMRKQRKKRRAPVDEDDSDDSIYDAAFVDGLNFHNVLGHQLVLWSYKDPDTLSLYTPVIGDNLATVLRLTKNSLQYDHHVHRLMILKPGTNHPMDISQFRGVHAGSAIMIVPKESVIICIEAKQLNLKFDMEVDLTMTVLQLKFRLQQERGLAVERLDLLFKDQPLENRKYLFNYRIGKQSTIFVMIHILYDILVHVETFWGTTYHLYLDPCMTGMNVIWSVLRRTVTKNSPDIMALFDLYLPKHTLVLYHRKKVINWSTCLGYYKIDDNDTIKLSTVGIYHKLSLQRIPICDDAGKMHTVKVSQYDRWSTVALKMHGVIGVSVNLIRIYKGNSQVDFAETIGKYKFTSPPVNMDLSLSKADPDVLYGVSLKFKLGHDVTEILKVSSKRDVRSVKAILEQLGVPNASVYDLYIGDYKLSNHEKIVTAVEDMDRPIDLKLTQYPVFIHTAQNVIYKMNVYGQETVAAFKKRIEMKSGLSFANYKLLLAGEEFTEGDELAVFDTRVAIRSSLFLRPRVPHDVFFVLYDDYMLKVKVPQKPKSHQLKHLLWEEMSLPSGALASVGTFLQWFYSRRSNPTMAAAVRRRKGPSGHFVANPVAGLDPYQVEDYNELQQDQIYRKRKPKDQDYPFKPIKKETDPVRRILYEQERIHDRHKGRAFSYPAQLFPSYETVKDKNQDNRKLRGYGSAEEYYDRKPKYKSHKPRWYNTLDRQREKRVVSPRVQDETYFLKKPKRRR